MPSRSKSPRTKKSKSPRTKTQRKSKTPSPGKGATREQSEVFHMAKAYRKMKGSPLRNFIKTMKKRANQVNKSITYKSKR